MLHCQLRSDGFDGRIKYDVWMVSGILLRIKNEPDWQVTEVFFCSIFAIYVSELSESNFVESDWKSSHPTLCLLNVVAFVKGSKRHWL